MPRNSRWRCVQGRDKLGHITKSSQRGGSHVKGNQDLTPNTQGKWCNKTAPELSRRFSSLQHPRQISHVRYSRSLILVSKCSPQTPSSGINDSPWQIPVPCAWKSTRTRGPRNPAKDPSIDRSLGRKNCLSATPRNPSFLHFLQKHAFTNKSNLCTSSRFGHPSNSTFYP